MSMASGALARILRVLLPVVGLLLASISAFSSEGRRPPIALSAVDRMVIARSFAEGKTSDEFLFATDPGKTSGLRAAIARVGGEVKYAADELGYVRAVVPFSALDAVASTPNLLALDASVNQFDGLSGLDEAPASGAAPIAPLDLPTPNSHTPQDNPFTALRAAGVIPFRRKHPTFDGRGVTIAVIEPLDPQAPGMQNARTLDGKPVRKVVDRITAVGPHDPTDFGGPGNQRLGWVDMTTEVDASTGTFEFNGKTLRAPAPGHYRAGSYRPDPALRLLKLDASKATPVDAADAFTLLWNPKSGGVWIDTKHDGTFAEGPLHAFGTSGDVGELPLRADWNRIDRREAKFPGDGLNDRVHFTLQIDEKDRNIAILQTHWTGHGAMVAGSAAGSGFYDGAFDGMAPGARLLELSGTAQPFSHTIEAMIFAARYPVDVITYESGYKVPENEQNEVFGRVLAELVRHYRVMITVSAANAGPGLLSVQTPSTASGVFSVGAYTSKDNQLYDEGSVVRHQDDIAVYSARGPRADGGLKPDFLAPTEWLSSYTIDGRAGMLRGEILLPPGYFVGGGTSQAAPTAAGAIALLVSAAKQSRLPYDAQSIRAAIVGSARRLDRYGAVDQGAGLIDVDAAWTALRSEIPNRRLQPESAGLYERDGWKVGMSATRTVWYARGASSPPSVNLSLIGNDGTFAVPATLALAKLKVPCSVRIAPRVSGVHSAILEARDPNDGQVLDARLLTIVAAEALDAKNGYHLRHETATEVPGFARYFVRVPEGTRVFESTLRIAPPGDALFSKQALSPGVLRVLDPRGLDTLDSVVAGNIANEWSKAVRNPAPGVWEIDVVTDSRTFLTPDPRRTRPIPPVKFSVDFAAYALRTASTEFVDSSHVKVAVVNEMAPLHLTAGSTSILQTTSHQIELGPKSTRVAVPFEVPAGTTEVRATVSGASGTARVDLYLFDCAAPENANDRGYLHLGTCNIRASSISPKRLATTQDIRGRNAGRTIVPAGHWIALVDSRTPLQKTMQSSVLIATAAPANGDVTLSSIAQATLATNQRTTATFEIHRPAESSLAGTRQAELSLDAGEAGTTFMTNKFSEMTNTYSTPVKGDRVFRPVWEAVMNLGNAPVSGAPLDISQLVRYAAPF